MSLNILTFFIFYFLIINSTLGFGYLINRIITKDIINYNLGHLGIFGIFGLILISYISHFFIPHNYVHNIILLSIGLLSFTDLQRIDSGELYKQDPKQADVLLDNLSSVRETMTKNLTTLTSSCSVRDATEVLANNNFHSIPIIENNELAGIVTSTDLLKYYLNEY